MFLTKQARVSSLASLLGWSRFHPSRIESRKVSSMCWHDTICQRSSLYLFYIVTYRIKWVTTTSWTYSTCQVVMHDILSIEKVLFKCIYITKNLLKKYCKENWMVNHGIEAEIVMRNCISWYNRRGRFFLFLDGGKISETGTTESR